MTRPRCLTLLLFCAIWAPMASAASAKAPAQIASAASDRLTADVDRAVAGFESTVAGAFKPVQRRLDDWRLGLERGDIAKLFDLLAHAQGNDRAYIASSILRLDPTQARARAEFTRSGGPAPFAPDGTPTPGWHLAVCRDRRLVDQVQSLSYPAFDVVRDAIDTRSPVVASYWRAQLDALNRLKSVLNRLARGGNRQSADLVYPIMAYYHPEASEVVAYFRSRGRPVPRQRVWFNPVDRYLLDHGLAGIDALTMPPRSGAPLAGGSGKPVVVMGMMSWDFPEYLRNCRLEMVLTLPAGNAWRRFVISDHSHHGVALTISSNVSLRLDAIEGSTTTMATYALDPTIRDAPLPIELEVHGSKVVLLISGIQVAQATLPHDHAYAQLAITGGGVVASELRIRYLSDRAAGTATGILTSGAANPTAPLPPTAPQPPWMAAPSQTLGRPISVAFSETTMDDVADILSRLTGQPFTLDPKAQLLHDLPVNLSGTSMPLGTVLGWIKKMTDLDCVPTSQGFSFTWNK